MTRLFWIDINYACFGIESKNGVVVLAAPIAKWMEGRTLESIRSWLISKKAKVVECKI